MGTRQIDPEKRHNMLLDRIYEKPSLIGIDPKEIMIRSKEYALISNGDFLVVPDIYFMTRTCKYLIEVKGSMSQTCKTKAKLQLEKMAAWIDQYDRGTRYQLGLIMPKRRSYSTLEKMLGDLDVSFITP